MPIPVFVIFNAPVLPLLNVPEKVLAPELLKVKVAAVEAYPLLIVEFALPALTNTALALFPFKLKVRELPIESVPDIFIEFDKETPVELFTVKLLNATVPLPGKLFTVAPDAKTIVPLLVIFATPPVKVPFIVRVMPAATVKVPPPEISRLFIVSLLSTAKVPEDKVTLPASGKIFAAAIRSVPPFIK